VLHLSQITEVEWLVAICDIMMLTTVLQNGWHKVG